MLLPLNDENPSHSLHRPVVNWSIIAICTAVFVMFQSGLVFALGSAMAVAYGFIPAVFMGNNTIAPDVFHVPTLLTPVTYMFLHGHWLHLIGNMLFLWVFGDNVEAEMGRLRYLLFFIGAGVASAIAYGWFVPLSENPLIGASGSVAAVLGAYLVLYPNVRIFGLLLNVIPVRIPAFWFIGGWFVLQVGHTLFDPNQSVAWIAHVVGLIVGALAVVLMRLPRGLVNLRRAGLVRKR